MKRIFGIDPGSHVTGWALLIERGSRVTCEHSGQIALPGDSLTERLTTLHIQLRDLLERHAPHEVAVESAFQARNARSALILGHARGVVLLTAGLAGLSVDEYAPREVKMAVVGRGAATKEQVQYVMKRMLALAVAPRADQADAMAVAMCHLHRARLKLPRTTRRRTPAGEAALWLEKAARR